jgi:hypothetical protein
MSDLSRLLGNVYGDDAPATDAPATFDEAVPTRAVAKLPEWADEDVLDEAFAHWVPGPPADAPAAERSMLTELAADTIPAAPTAAPAAEPAFAQPVVEIDDSSHDDLYQPMIDPLLAAVTAQAAIEHAVSRGWQRGDDDILPAKSGGKSRRLALR